MFIQPSILECISIFEPAQGVWHSETVETPTLTPDTTRQDSDEEDFEAFCRRSLSC